MLYETRLAIGLKFGLAFLNWDRARISTDASSLRER
jgi:hypothetical protein